MTAGVDRVIVSTDSPEIANAARRAGAEVPFLRPPELANHAAATFGVVRHAVRWLEDEGQEVDIVVTMQPTSPFCRPETVEKAIEHLDDLAVDSATTITHVGVPASVVGIVESNRFVWLIAHESDQRRQASAPLARLTGAVYVTRRVLLDTGRLLGDRPAFVLTTGVEAIDIDTPADLAAARRAYRRMATLSR